MLRVEEGRWIMKCNECPIRVDVAPAAYPEDQLRPPTGWLSLGDGVHVCSQCGASRWAQFRQTGGTRIR